MPPSEGKHIFGDDREKHWKKEEVVVVGIIQQQADRDHADEGAERDHSLAMAKQPVQSHVEQTARCDRHQDLNGGPVKAESGAP